MSTGILVAGLSHKTAPIGLLERLAVADERLPKALHQLLTYEHVFEGAVLSTCNRIEVYAAASRFHGGAQDLRNFFAEFCHVAPEDFVDHLYTYHEEGAVEHLFRVASGIDSMVVGESEILGQVKRAYQLALEEQAARRFLGRAFRQALRVGKRARSETAISRNPASISSAAVAVIVTIPLTVPTGLVSATAGAVTSFATVTTLLAVVSLPAASRATAVRVCDPFDVVSVFHDTSKGSEPSSPPSGAPCSRSKGTSPSAWNSAAWLDAVRRCRRCSG